jgi:hypothetical protein
MGKTGGDISSAPLSVVGLVALDVEVGVGGGWDELGSSVNDGLFAFQGRRMVAISSLALALACPRRGMLESEVLLPASVGPERARVDWLDLKRAEDMSNGLHRIQPTVGGMAFPWEISVNG